MSGKWFSRTFQLGLPSDAAPEILDRLRSTPDRLAAAVAGLPPEVLRKRRDGKWSIQENAGHLFDLESLWDQRLDDYARGAKTLHPADLENRKTHEADHNSRQITEILENFRTARFAIIEKIARMAPAELSRTALHPRLNQPMTVTDLCFFVAEHDDHHLRTIEELRSALVS
ncbi:MAG TPA: DinB family protein [Chthoniobacterales bacterium]|nr:DinB family protein [Chthoniobacterales bacterium]